MNDAANACFIAAGCTLACGLGWIIYRSMDWVEYAPSPEELKRMKEREDAFHKGVDEWCERNKGAA